MKPRRLHRLTIFSMRCDSVDALIGSVRRFRRFSQIYPEKQFSGFRLNLWIVRKSLDESVQLCGSTFTSVLTELAMKHCSCAPRFISSIFFGGGCFSPGNFRGCLS